MNLRCTAKAALLMLVIAPALSQAQATKPSNDRDFMRSSRADLIASLHLHPLGTSTETEREIGTILRALPLGLPRTPDVWVCEGCGTSSHPDVGIIVDPVQLEQIRRQFQVQNFHALLIFVVAHEAAHQLQFARYNHDLFRLSSAERQYYEAQADILAGVYLYQSGASRYDPEQTRSLSDALRVIYDLGGEEYALADHPSKSGRFLAARAGMQYALARSVSAGTPAAGQDVASLRRRLDLHPDDDDLSFSLRMARRIVQFNPVATQDLVQLTEKSNIKWDKSAEHPFVQYRVTYENRGSKALKVTVQVQTTSVARANPDDLFSAVPSDADYSTFTIAPGKTQTVSGELRWIAGEDLYPRIIYPPDALGLIEVRYADGSDPSADNGSYDPNRMGLVDVPAGERSNLIYIFNKFIRASRNGYADIRGGPGKGYSDDIRFPCNTPLPGSVQDEIIFPTKRGDQDFRIRSILLRTMDESKAKEQYAREVALVRAALGSVSVPNGDGKWTEVPDSGGREPRDFWTQEGFHVAVRLHTDKVETGIGNEPTYYNVEVNFSSDRN